MRTCALHAAYSLDAVLLQEMPKSRLHGQSSGKTFYAMLGLCTLVARRWMTKASEVRTMYERPLNSNRGGGEGDVMSARRRTLGQRFKLPLTVK